ncbi:MAG: RDD family protein [Methylotenera sp.]|nr:RDD family protein [Methylotenera sp.]
MNKKVKMSDFLQAPSLLKLGACFIYDALAVIALCFVCALVFIILIGDASHGLKRYMLQLFLWVAIGVYFVWCWKRSGQTLAMQTWQLKVVNEDYQLLTWNRAMTRYVLASVSLMLFGLGFLWAIVDRGHLFLHDRLLNTNIIYVPRNAAS